MYQIGIYTRSSSFIPFLKTLLLLLSSTIFEDLCLRGVHFVLFSVFAAPYRVFLIPIPQLKFDFSSTSNMGYDIQLFQEQPVQDAFLCPICKDVFQDPLTITGCQHVFCNDCIKTWLGFRTPSNQHLYILIGHNDCPECRTDIHKFDDLKPTYWLFLQIMDRLKLRCSFESCIVVTTLDLYDKHIDECPENPANISYKCPNLCGARICLKLNHKCIPYLVENIKSTTERVNDKIDLLAKDSPTYNNFQYQKQLDKFRRKNHLQLIEIELLKVELQLAEFSADNLTNLGQIFDYCEEEYLPLTKKIKAN